MFLKTLWHRCAHGKAIMEENRLGVAFKFWDEDFVVVRWMMANFGGFGMIYYVILYLIYLILAGIIM